MGRGSRPKKTSALLLLLEVGHTRVFFSMRIQAGGEAQKIRARESPEAVALVLSSLSLRRKYQRQLCGQNSASC